MTRTGPAAPDPAPAPAGARESTAAARGRGCFVAVEGVEGAGKSTQAARLAAWLRGLGFDVTQTREPGGTDVGERIRDLLLHARDAKIGAPTELLLVLAARAAFVRELVRPALERGQWVVSDRFAMSTFAYQGYGRGLDLDRIGLFNRWAADGLAPDLYVVLDLPVAQGLARKASGGEPGDRIESAGPDFLRRVQRGYVEMAGPAHHASGTRARLGGAIALVDAAGPLEEVERRVRRVVRERLLAARRSPAGPQPNQETR